MYQPHNLLWFIFCTVLCASGIFVTRLLSLKVKNKWGIISKIFCLGFVLFGLLAVCTKTYDDYRLRTELRRIPTDKILNFRLSNGKSSREIVSPSDISALISRIQLLKDVWSHHSHPIDPFTIDFKFDGDNYEYEIGRDSERPNEYWINAVGRDEDIGRSHSSDLGQILQSLLAEKP